MTPIVRSRIAFAAATLLIRVSPWLSSLTGNQRCTVALSPLDTTPKSNYSGNFTFFFL